VTAADFMTKHRTVAMRFMEGNLGDICTTNADMEVFAAGGLARRSRRLDKHGEATILTAVPE
jgi:hypothetical protein